MTHVAKPGQKVRCIDTNFRFAPPWQKLPELSQILTVKEVLTHPTIPDVQGYTFLEVARHETLGDPVFDIQCFETFEEMKTVGES